MRVLLAGMGLGLTAAVGVAGTKAVSRGAGADREHASRAATASTPVLLASAIETHVPALDAAPLDTVSPTPAAEPALVPIIAEGHTRLADSLHAVRTSGTVVVHFDTPLTRTRRRDKFEATVRATLPAIYGAAADSLLAAIPVGSLAPEADLVRELTATGVHLPIGSGWTLALWPETRPGQDGPLVVRYRAVVTR